jgi:ABC-type spermidine/putrescine transport system permease subunit I
LENTFKKRLIEIASVLTISLIVGIVIGVIQGWFAFADAQEYRPGMTLVAGAVGAEFAIVLGPLLYYALLRKRIDWRSGSIGISVCLLLGSLAAWWLARKSEAGWLSVFITPILAIVISFFIRVYANAARRLA